MHMNAPGRKRQAAQPLGSDPHLPARKRLADMTPQEKVAWVQARYEGLAAFVAEARRYRSRRTWPGSDQNPTNQMYDRFLPEAADLLAALEEMRMTADQAAQEGQQDP